MNREFDRFMPQVKQIIAPYLIREATLHEDRKEVSDLVSEAKRISVRLRSHNYLKYADEFTIRDSNYSSEMQKIIEGHGEWMFYGFVENETIIKWTLLSLTKFRAALIKNPDLLNTKRYPIGDAAFFGFKITDDLVIARG